jgi:ATPase subunit of ABC transporter with duplicated ATPase domains
MERFVERFRYKATKARQAQSKLKGIERLRRAMPEAAPTDGRSLSFEFGAPERSGRVVLELEGGAIAVPGRTLIADAELWLERGEHVTLVGANGSGKSTLVETLVGARSLKAGKLRRGNNVRLGYLAQNTEHDASPDTTVLAHAQRATGLSEAKTRALLGRFLFSGEEVAKSLTDLSGGESRRLALAILTSSDANALILDEPADEARVALAALEERVEVAEARADADSQSRGRNREAAGFAGAAHGTPQGEPPLVGAHCRSEQPRPLEPVRHAPLPASPRGGRHAHRADWTTPRSRSLSSASL